MRSKKRENCLQQELVGAKRKEAIVECDPLCLEFVVLPWRWRYPFLLHALRGSCWFGGVFGTQLKGQTCVVNGTIGDNFRGRNALDYLYLSWLASAFRIVWRRVLAEE